jgi:glycosyltransferase involved in cell wall biosynthesis
MELTKELKRTLKNFDLVHIQGIFVYPCLVTARLCQKLGVPYVTTPRGVLDPYCLEYRGLKKRIYYLLAEKRNLDGARLIHFTSNEEQERASRLKLKAPSAVVPNCVDIRRFAALPSKGRFRSRYPNIKGRKILLFLGRIHFKKGLDLLIEAFRNLIPKYPDWCLVIAGSDDGGYQRRAMSQILEAGISQHVIFTGLVVGEQKLELFADSDILVLPSYNENFGMSVVEAMAAGLPVVISDQVQIWTDVKEAQAGMICPCETQGLQEAIEKLIQDSSLRERMGGNGKLLVQQKYSTDTVVPQMRELYRKALR